MKLEQSFDKFLKDTVNLNQTRIDIAETGIETMTNFLKENEVFSDLFIGTSPQGSFRQQTIIKPVDPEMDFDVDLLFEMKVVEGWEPKDYLLTLSDQFRETERYEDLVDTQGKERCVTIDYESDFHIDIVPTISLNGVQLIMNKTTNKFESTDGNGYADWFASKNKITGNKYLTKVVRLAKYIRDTHEDFEIKSILLTTLLGNQVLESDNRDYFYADLPTAFVTIFSRLDSFLQANSVMPEINNPVLSSENFNRKWNQEKYSEFRKEIHKITTSAMEAHGENNENESLKKWQKIFGEDFSVIENKSRFIGTPEDFIDEYSDTEQFLLKDRNIKTIKTNHSIKIEILINQDGFRPGQLLRKLFHLRKNYQPIYKVVESTIDEPYEVMWKIKNSGVEARNVGKLRGEIYEDHGLKQRDNETAMFSGVHYIECYAIKEDVCIAQDRVYVKIP